MGKDTITRDEVVFQATLALATARKAAAELYERIVAGEDWYVVRYNAQDVLNAITEALAWAFAGTQKEQMALMMREAHAQATLPLAIPALSPGQVQPLDERRTP